MKTAKSFSCRNLSFKYVKEGDPGLGFVVSTKYGTAVQRNLFKRRCRSVFRLLFITTGVQASIIVRPKSNNVSYKSIVSSFSSVYEKIAS